ncbi:MAG: HIT family protein [Bauldia sp.]
MSYDPNNVFAKIIRGDLPSHKVYEDDAVLVIMDIMPISPGHVLVIPKKPSRHLLDADDATLAEAIKAVRRIAQAAMTGMGADGVAIRQHNEEAAGQSVFHLHFNVIPRWADRPLREHPAPMESPEVLKENAERIRRALV